MEKPSTYMAAKILVDQPSTIVDAFSAHSDIPPITLHHALVAIALDPKAREVLTEYTPDQLVTFLPDPYKKPFETVISEDLPNIYGRLMISGLATRINRDENSNFTGPEQLATRVLFQSEDSLRMLTPANGTLPTFLRTISKVVIKGLQDAQEATGLPYTEKDIIQRLKVSFQAITGAAALTVEDFQKLGLESHPESHMKIDRNGRTLFDTEGFQLHEMRGRGCPMNVFGTLKEIFNHYVTTVEYILDQRNNPPHS